MGAPDMDQPSFTDSNLDVICRKALDDAEKGNCDYNSEIVGVLHRKERLAATEVALLVTNLKSIAGAVSYIRRDHHGSLLAAISNMSLWDYGTDVMDALVELLISLASSNGECFDTCLEMLVRNFMPPKASASYFLELLKQPQGLAKCSSSFPSKTREDTEGSNAQHILNRTYDYDLCGEFAEIGEW